MKTVLIITILSFLPLWGIAQTDSLELNAQLTDINQNRLTTNKRGMFVLGGWALANIGLGLTMRTQTSGAEKQFWTMNAGWNGVNIALAGFGLYGAYTGATDLSLGETTSELHNIQKVLLVNAGLDVGYMATGMWLRERGKRNVKHTDRWTGWGNALLIQGGFLLAFDVIMALRHSRNNSTLSTALDNVELSVGANGIGLGYIF